MHIESHDPSEPDLVPIVLIAAEVGETPGAIAHRFREVLVLDDIGMRAVSVDVARRYFAALAEQAAESRRRQAELLRLLKEREAKEPKFRGIPAPAGAPLGSAWRYSERPKTRSRIGSTASSREV